MGTKRVLDDREARDAAICYLCGVGGSHIKKEWNIALSRISDSIIKNKSNEWGDPLLEYYKARGRSCLNFAHFYLAYHEEKIEKKELVLQDRDKSIYDAVQEDIVRPIFAQVALQANLESFLEPDTAAEFLLNDILGNRTIEKVLEPIICDLLRGKVWEFQFGTHADPKTGIVFLRPRTTPLTVNEIALDLKRTVNFLLKHGGAAMTPHKMSVIKRSLATLAQRELLVLQLNYGLSGFQKISLEEIGKLLNLTAERVRQIRQKALRRLRHSYRIEKLREIHELMIDPANSI